MNIGKMCLLDLQIGLPVEVRDVAIGTDRSTYIPKTYFVREEDSKAKVGLDDESSFETSDLTP